METGRIHYIILFIIILSINLLVFNYIPLSFAGSDQFHKELDCSLSDLDIDVDILEIWSNKYKHDNIFGNKIKQLVITKILLLRSANPDIDSIKWNQLESINRMIDFVKQNDLTVKENDLIGDLASKYLLSIENDVKETLKARKNERLKFINEIQNRLHKLK